MFVMVWWGSRHKNIVVCGSVAAPTFLHIVFLLLVFRCCVADLVRALINQNLLWQLLRDLYYDIERRCSGGRVVSCVRITLPPSPLPGVRFLLATPQAEEEVEALVNKLSTSFPAVAFVDDSWSAQKQQAKEVVLRAAVTRLENFLCQTLKRSSSSKTESRIAQYTAEFSNGNPGALWKDHVHKSIVRLVASAGKPSK